MLPTAEQVEAFRRDGFVVVENVLSDAQLDRFGAAVDGAVARRTADDDRPFGEKSLYEQSFIQCMNLWETDADVRELSFDAEIGELAAGLLGVDALRIWHDQALYKEPGGRQTDAHQDLPFWPLTPANQITAWIPFDGSTRDGGAMSYVPGSHSVGLKKFVDISHRTEPYDVMNDPAIAGIDPVLVEAPRGSIVFHHSLTVHQAHANITDHTRRVYCIIWFADGCTRSKDWAHVIPDRQGVKLGEPMAGEVTPVAWPRDDLPPPPATEGPTTGFEV